MHPPCTQGGSSFPLAVFLEEMRLDFWLRIRTKSLWINTGQGSVPQTPRSLAYSGKREWAWMSDSNSVEQSLL